MATTALIISDKQIENDLAQARKELSHVQERLRGEEARLAAAKRERGDLVDGVARGRTEPSSVLKLDGTISEIEIRLEGLRKIPPPIEARITELTKETSRRQVAAARAAREKERDARAEKLKARFLQIRETLALLCTGELFTAEQERAMIASEYGDIGGVEIAKALSEILFAPSHPSQALRNPEVHLAHLDAAGLVPFGFKVVSELRPSVVQGARGEYVSRLRPASPLCFTVLAMGPRAS